MTEQLLCPQCAQPLREEGFPFPNQRRTIRPKRLFRCTHETETRWYLFQLSDRAVFVAKEAFDQIAQEPPAISPEENLEAYLLRILRSLPRIFEYFTS